MKVALSLIEKYDVDTFLSIDTDNKLQEASLNSTKKTSYDDLFKEKQQLLDNNLPYDKRYK